MFQCFSDDRNRVRRPDTSFISWDRITPEQARAERYVKVAPDLTVEVLSLNHLAYTIDQKVSDFLAAGTSLIWVINPDAKTVAVHRIDSLLEQLPTSTDSFWRLKMSRMSMASDFKS